MIHERPDLSVRRQCQLLGVNRSNLYYAPRPQNDSVTELRENVMARIDYWHTRLPGIGSRKLLVMLRQEGFSIGRKYVRNCMARMGIHAIYPKVNLSKCTFKAAVVPYLLRNYEVCFPGQVWSVDITYIKMGRSHMYLTAVIDWYSRKIVGWDLSDTLAPQSAINAIKKAIEANGTPAIINSDQGSQFTSDAYKLFLRESHIRQSMDGKSRWADNIMIERWFRTLKTEEIYPNEYRSPKELRAALGQYIHKYNAVRPHQALNYKTPDQVYAESFCAAG